MIPAVLQPGNPPPHLWHHVVSGGGTPGLTRAARLGCVEVTGTPGKVRFRDDCVSESCGLVQCPPLLLFPSDPAS